ncbi:MAG TPA: hypothetical protein VFD36_25950 [Kofleriaceae bacterium]|nr:hypothetical protein [Kofleriaceae bacterium]
MIRRAMRRALQWRLLVLSPVVLLVAATATLFPLLRALGEVFDRSPRWQELTGLDSFAAAGLAKVLQGPASGTITTGVQTSIVLALLLAPLLAGAALVVADADARPRIRGLLSGAAAYYPRLLRMQLAALIPLGAAGLLTSVLVRWSSHVDDAATSEAATHASSRIAWTLAIALVFVAQLVVDAGRARLAAEPERRSAVKALGAGVKLIVKRPAQALAIGASTTAASLLIATIVLVVRNQFAQTSGAAVLFAFLIGQLAVMAIAWGRAAKLCGLVEIARDLVNRDR